MTQYGAEVRLDEKQCEEAEVEGEKDTKGRKKYISGSFGENSRKISALIVL